MTRVCFECRARNPKYRSACYRCNAPLSNAERERRERRRILNEQREANGKDPLPIEETDHSVEEVESPNPAPVVFALLVCAVLVGAGFYYGVLP